MTDPTTGHNDDALGAALRGMPRPSVDPAVREAHIAAALGALAPAIDADSNVISLASRRRPRLMTLTAVAAAALFAVGIGIGRVSAPTTGSPNTAVKNSALAASPAAGDSVVEGCPDLALDAPATVVTTFGTYALYRAGSGNGATLVVVDTAACAIVTRVADPG